MQLRHEAMGSYQTNCYIVETSKGEIIIDPGMGATEWVKSQVKQPLAILNTHGHFDHVWSNAALKEAFDIPIYCPKEDAFMLLSDPFGLGIEPSAPDVEVVGDAQFDIGGTKVQFWHFPGHTPGCSAIEIDEMFFSGDFIFQGSIGRVDFPFSSPEKMKESIEKFLAFEKDMIVYPGHGPSTSVEAEQRSLPRWLRMI